MPLNSFASDRVLCVFPGLPDQCSGGGVVLFELLAWLAARVGPAGAVAVVAPVNADRAPELARLQCDPALPRVAWHPLRERRVPGMWGRLQRMLGPLPADMAKVATAENASRLAEVRAAFRPTVELAVSSWAFAAYPRQLPRPGTRLFMVNVDPDVVRYDGPWRDRDAALRKLACLIDQPKVRRICRRALTAAARVAAISPADVAPLDRLGGRNDTVHLPPLVQPRPLDRSAAVPGSVLVTTNFAYQPNVVSLEWFLREVWPRLETRAELTVTGADPLGIGQRLCANHSRVRCVGLLPTTELDAAYARTAVAVNPTRTGSGFQVKLLDALARGVPIVSTAWSNKVGPMIAASDDPAEMARLIGDRLSPGSTPSFDYAAFHAAATAAWEAFLFG